MIKYAIAGISLALLTASPVLAQMTGGQPPASTSNTGGSMGPADGEPPNAPGSGAGSTQTTTGYANPNGHGYGPTNNSNGTCNKTGNSGTADCRTYGKPHSGSSSNSQQPQDQSSPR